MKEKGRQEEREQGRDGRNKTRQDKTRTREQVQKGDEAQGELPTQRKPHSRGENDRKIVGKAIILVKVYSSSGLTSWCFKQLGGTRQERREHQEQQ